MISNFCNSKEETLLQASQKLVSELKRLVENKTPTLFLASGGSALQLLNDIPADVLGPHLTISVLDDRYSSDPAINNFSQLMQTRLYADAATAGAKFIDTRPQPDETQEEVVQRLEKGIRDWRKNYPQGFILITQGIGPDGHTSGIMPFPENPTYFKNTFENSGKCFVGYDAKGKNPYPLRITATISFLREVDVSILFACGEDKKVAFERLRAEEGTLAETPARIIKEMKQVYVFTDVTI